MKKAIIGEPVENFTLEASNGKAISLKDFSGQDLILYFYPKDNTPGCTLEAKNFRDLHDQFKKTNAVIFGVSRDTVKKHENFVCKYDLPFLLLSDPDSKLCDYFDVIRTKKLFGLSYEGIERSTFHIDKAGILRQAWRKIKVKNHAEMVLNYLQSFQQQAVN